MLASHKCKAAKKSAMLISFCSFLLSFQQRCSLYLIELCLKRTVAISSALRKWLACRLATSGPPFSCEAKQCRESRVGVPSQVLPRATSTKLQSSAIARSASF